jgi:putative heme iron utilization protein
MSPTHAESARTLAARARFATLATQGWEGHPHGSLVSYALAPGGEPILLLSRLAAHTQNLEADPRASLLITETLTPLDALAAGRVTLLGSVELCSEADARERPTAHRPREQGRHPASDRECFLASHPSASGYIDLGDFHLYRLRVKRIRYIGGFARMSWVDVDGWRSADPDPLARAAPGIVEHMNVDHADALVLYCQAFGDAPDTVSARMLDIDQYGFDVEALDQAGKGRSVRLDFGGPIGGSGAARTALVDLVKRARAKLQG